MWTMRAEDAITSIPDRPAMTLVTEYDPETKKPAVRRWTLLDPVTGAPHQNFPVQIGREPMTRRLARDFELSWMLYSTRHTDQCLIDGVLASSTFPAGTKIHILHKQYRERSRTVDVSDRRYIDIWRMLGGIDGRYLGNVTIYAMARNHVVLKF